jgi:hypothetical protein
MQQLDRNRTVQPKIPAVAYLGHPTAAQNPPQFVAAAKSFWRLHTSTLSWPVREPSLPRSAYRHVHLPDPRSAVGDDMDLDLETAAAEVFLPD